MVTPNNPTLLISSKSCQSAQTRKTSMSIPIAIKMALCCWDLTSKFNCQTLSYRHQRDSDPSVLIREEVVLEEKITQVLFFSGTKPTVCIVEVSVRRDLTVVLKPLLL